ncbi:unnamed protein product [Caenorhabditis sp. 36 PRJEB53466]|nr:unnamed protein product [Caenorhabditis sp. 36 PRJEB53466]
MRRLLLLSLSSLLLLCPQTYAKFTADFSQWLSDYYGPRVRDQIERLDLGPGGSRARSVGHGRREAHLCGHVVQTARLQGNEIYSTTYFNGAQGNPLKWIEYSMKCEYVKQVRALIVAVRLYTGRNVDVIGFSLGVPVSRKAILGGRCVDTGENLGGPLTRVIDTYIGVAGPNRGAAPQLGPLSVPACALSITPICNQVNGLYSGNCPAQSDFLQDINRYAHYEGQYTYSIYTQKDQMVGYTVCGQLTSPLPGQNGQRVYTDLNHDQVFDNTHEVQLRMIKDHVVT